MIDCGCFGCSLRQAYSYVRDNGIDLANEYAYRADDGYCKTTDANITITDYERIPKGSEEKLKEAIATIGPISV